MSEACCWPEQDAVWAWMKKHNIELTFEQENELKDAVSEYRIKVQRELDALKVVAQEALDVSEQRRKLLGEYQTAYYALPGKIADFCFGSKDQPGSCSMQAAYLSVAHCLTAKDGLDATLPIIEFMRK